MKGKVHTMSKKRLLSILTAISVVLLCFTTCAQAMDIKYNMIRNSYANINDCAYNGYVYVFVGEAGFIAVSDSLTGLTEIPDVCYSRIEKIIWDGSNFIFISSNYVYRSPDGYSWTKQPCIFADDVLLHKDNKYVVKIPGDYADHITFDKIGYTTDFTDFTEIDINYEEILPSGLKAMDLSPWNISIVNNLFFAVNGKAIFWSSDLITWNELPRLPEDGGADLSIVYFNNSYRAYSWKSEYNISCSTLNTLDDKEWVVSKIDVISHKNLDRSYGLQIIKVNNTLYFVGDRWYTYKSTDGENFIEIPVIDAKCIQAGDNIVTFSMNGFSVFNTSTEEWTTYDYKQNYSDIAYPDRNFYWTGKEYVKYFGLENQVQLTIDKQHYTTLDILPDSHSRLVYGGFRKVFLWTGENYMIRNEGVGSAVWLYDSSFNFITVFEFEGDVLDMSYCNGKYYVRVGKWDNSSTANIEYCKAIYSSEDFQNWNVEEGLTTVPITNHKSMVIAKREWYDYINPAGSNISGYEIKTGNSAFTPIIYETETAERWITVMEGIYVALMKDANDRLFLGFSNDGVYYTRVPLPESFYIYMENPLEEILRTDSKSIIYRHLYWAVIFNIDEIRNAINIENPTYVKVNNKILGFDTPPVIENDRTLVPLRLIFETLGAKVDWDGETQSALVEGSNKSIMFSINDTNARVNDQIKQMDVPARLIDSKTMVPLRFLSEELGFTVSWDEGNRIATISE